MSQSFSSVKKKWHTKENCQKCNKLQEKKGNPFIFVCCDFDDKKHILRHSKKQWQFL